MLFRSFEDGVEAVREAVQRGRPRSRCCASPTPPRPSSRCCCATIRRAASIPRRALLGAGRAPRLRRGPLRAGLRRRGRRRARCAAAMARVRAIAAPPRRAARSAARPAAPGAATASARRTCATGCSTHGVAVDTMETALPWCAARGRAPRRSLRDLRARPRDARRRGPRDGAPLPQLPRRRVALLHDPLPARCRAARSKQWAEIKRDATEAMLSPRRHALAPPRRRRRPPAVDGAREGRRSASRRCAP